MAPLRLWVSKLDISYCIVPIRISYRTKIWGSWQLRQPMSLNFLVVQFNFNLLLGQDSVQSVQWSMTWAKQCHWVIWGNWPMSLTFLVVQFNSNLLPGQASVHSVQWSTTWAKRLPPLSCSSTSVVATPLALFLSSIFIWRQLSFERCSNLWGSLWPHNPSSSFNWSQLVSDWLILTMLSCWIAYYPAVRLL